VFLVAINSNHEMTRKLMNAPPLIQSKST